MKRILQFVVFIFPLIGSTQSLLLNGSFEAENICTEYNINCAPEAWINSMDGMNNYFRDPNRSFDGSHCISIQVGHAYKPYVRGFMRSRLVCGMRKGSIYRLEFYIKSPHPVLDSIGVYFGPNDPVLERKPIHLLAPSLRLIDQGNKFVNDSSWQKATLDYTANGNEAYITIANFSIKDITGPTGFKKENNFYIYIDRVSLIPLNPNEKLCDDWQQTKEDIYDENERHFYLTRYIPQRKNLTPLKPTPTVVFAADTLLLPDLLFASGKKELVPASQVVLDSFCTIMKGKLIDSLIVEGHTDNTGTNEANEELAIGRAEAAAGYLSRCASFFKVPVETFGWGSRQPVAGNETPQGRQQNRRVELRVYYRE